MAIAAANVTYSGNGPTQTGQILADAALRGNFARTLFGTATFTGDAASSTAILNYIDGTAVLGFAPTAVIAQRIGGAATATIGVVSVADNADNGKTATVTFTGTVNAATLQIGLIIAK